MSAKPVRWMMTGQGEPLVQTEIEMPFSGARRSGLIEIAGCGVCHTDLGLLLRRRANQARSAADARA